jgi:hypothetical protein
MLVEVFGIHAAVELVPDAGRTVLFGNGKRTIETIFRNTGDQPAEASLGFRLYQASASTLAPLGETRFWRTVPFGIGQIGLESVQIDLPAVRGETVFKAMWFDGTKKLGATSFRVFPENFLRSLGAFSSDLPVGLLDPEGHFKAALSTVQVQELKEAEGIFAAETRLILIAPMRAENRPAGLLGAIKKKAFDGAGVVWVQSPRPHAIEPGPDAYVLHEGTGRVVIAAAEPLLPLADSPLAQLKLLRLAELAAAKAKLDWPAEPQP